MHQIGQTWQVETYPTHAPLTGRYRGVFGRSSCAWEAGFRRRAAAAPNPASTAEVPERHAAVADIRSADRVLVVVLLRAARLGAESAPAAGSPNRPPGFRRHRANGMIPPAACLRQNIRSEPWDRPQSRVGRIADRS